MTKEFEKRVMREKIVDTRIYRYILKEDTGRGIAKIMRLPLAALDTTEALNGWEVVKVIR